MGSAGGEEVAQNAMQGFSGHEENIFVSVRLRPLNESEIAVNEAVDWECINDTTILYRNTLREGCSFPSSYTFVRHRIANKNLYYVFGIVFRGDCSTRQVYDEGAKEIALSVVNGINSSIFAYGQTSSGKTYTMTGITEYAVADIFDYIHMHKNREFVLKLSAIEIYNEAIRDLFSSDHTPLRLRDDLERGIVVEKVIEEALRDWNHFMELVSICEAQRQIGETALNERSSRSHQILKLTVESSAREFMNRESSTTLSASVNFIDLAGSERASQAQSAGIRLKEGCHINRSLLTLGTVIRKLSSGRGGHVNYRDSKLTRILQPALGGNARTAIICTVSPARSHVELTRNSLLFASCAKDVTTNARVNVVMSDKAYIKHLQDKLARLESELKVPAPGSSTCNCAESLRKKDLHIEKMEQKICELTKQRDHAQSRVEDLLQLLETYKDSRQAKGSASDELDDHCSIPGESSVGRNQDHSINEVPSSPLSHGKKSVRSDLYQIDKQTTKSHGISETAMSVEGREVESEILAGALNVDRKTSCIQNGFRHLQDVAETTDSLLSSSIEKSYPQGMALNESSSRRIKLRRSMSCRAKVLAGLYQADMADMADQSGGTPPDGFERNFSERPQSVRRKFPALNFDRNSSTLLRNDSESSSGSSSILLTKNAGDENIASVQTFISGLNEAKFQYEKQLADGWDVKHAALDPRQGTPGSLSNWPQEFERQQKEILELWHTCNVSLVHRTYFFLLFKGDPKDSIYLEVELQRLTFLKEENRAGEDGRNLKWVSSMKALKREKEMLSKLMEKRFSEEERNKLYKKWGISVRSKRRKLQLANLLWNNPKDMTHVAESASIVARLVEFVEQGQVLKGMFGLNFAPPGLKRKTLSWTRSMGGLL